MDLVEVAALMAVGKAIVMMDRSPRSPTGNGYIFRGERRGGGGVRRG